MALVMLAEPGRRQRNAVVAISRTGGIVEYARPSEDSCVRAFQEWVAATLGVDFAYRVVDINIDADWIDVAVLDGLPHVESAILDWDQPGGPVFANVLARLPGLNDLCISRTTEFTVADVLTLQRLPRLKKLKLHFVDDRRAVDVVRAIVQVEQLCDLFVTCPRLTSDMVAILSKAKGLERLTVFVTEGESPAGARQLQEALPACSVVHSTAPLTMTLRRAEGMAVPSKAFEP